MRATTLAMAAFLLLGACGGKDAGTAGEPDAGIGADSFGRGGDGADPEPSPEPSSEPLPAPVPDLPLPDLPPEPAGDASDAPEVGPDLSEAPEPETSDVPPTDDAPDGSETAAGDADAPLPDVGEPEDAAETAAGDAGAEPDVLPEPETPPAPDVAPEPDPLPDPLPEPEPEPGLPLGAHCGGEVPCEEGACLLGTCTFPCLSDGDCDGLFPGAACAGVVASGPLLATGACLDNAGFPAGAACASAAECASAVCLGGQCRSHCGETAACGEGELCEGAVVEAGGGTAILGVCVPEPGSKAPCGANADCPQGEWCQARIEPSGPSAGAAMWLCLKAEGPLPPCPSGDVECPVPTHCVPVPLHDAATPDEGADDPTAGLCVDGGPGAACDPALAGACDAPAFACLPDGDGGEFACQGEAECSHAVHCPPVDVPCAVPACSGGACIPWAPAADGMPCDDGDPCSLDDACLAGKCLGTTVAAPCALPDTCPKELAVAAFDFSGGLPDGAEVEDDDPLDAVTVTWVEEPASSLPGSVYFGDPACLSYEDALDLDCAPPEPPEPPDPPPPAEGVDLALRLPALALPAQGPILLGFETLLAAEPEDDGLSVLLEAAGAEPVVLWSSAADLGPGNSTGGAFVPVEIDLSSWSGGTVALVFRFASDGEDDLNPDPLGEPWTGAWIDDVAVTGPCDECVIAADCALDACVASACVDGACVVAPEPACCHPQSVFPKATEPSEVAAEGFEFGVLPAGWTVQDPLPGDNVTWSVDSQKNFAGKMALFFGSKTSQTYVSNLNAPAKATAWTPWFDLDAADPRPPVLSFAVLLSTEWDVALEPPGEDNLFDVLEVVVEAKGAGAVPIWSSNAIGGTTSGAWLPVSLPLDAFEGGEVRIGFVFDSFDAADNAFGGARIDEVSVDRVCDAPACSTAADCDDGNVCSSDLCLAGRCDHVADPGCCLHDLDCDDGNSCTVDLCKQNSCASAVDPALAPSCCSEAPWPGVPVFDFESGEQGFTILAPTAPVAWHRKEGPSSSGDFAFTFSDPKTGFYAGKTATTGQLVSPPVAVPPYGLGVPYASFHLLLSTEWDDLDFAQFSPSFLIDELRVRIALAGPAGPDPAPPKAPIHWKSHYLGNSTHGLWLETKVDLSAYRGESIHLVFEFTSGDSFSNDFQGPFVDDVSFGQTCLPDAEIECVYGGDCPPLPATCKSVTCDAFECVEAPFTAGCIE